MRELTRASTDELDRARRATCPRTIGAARLAVFGPDPITPEGPDEAGPGAEAEAAPPAPALGISESIIGFAPAPIIYRGIRL